MSDGRSIDPGLEALTTAWIADGYSCGAQTEQALSTDDVRAYLSTAAAEVEKAKKEEREWGPGDLKCAREALGLSQQQLAEYLPWRGSRVSECEAGKRVIRGWMMERISALEAIRDELADRMTDACEQGGYRDLVVSATDEDYRVAHPTDPLVPAAVQRVAAAIAASRIERKTGERPRIYIRGGE